jgi:hypothetical protein
MTDCDVLLGQDWVSACQPTLSYGYLQPPSAETVFKWPCGHIWTSMCRHLFNHPLLLIQIRVRFPYALLARIFLPLLSHTSLTTLHLHRRSC